MVCIYGWPVTETCQWAKRDERDQTDIQWTKIYITFCDVLFFVLFVHLIFVKHTNAECKCEDLTGKFPFGILQPWL